MFSEKKRELCLFYLSRLSQELKDVIVVKKHVFLNVVEKYERLKWKKIKLTWLQLSLLDMPEYTWMCLYKQDSEYALSPKYAKILNMSSQYGSVTQHFAYVRICLDRVLTISRVLNMPGFWIWEGSEYARITQGSKYATI